VSCLAEILMEDRHRHNINSNSNLLLETFLSWQLFNGNGILSAYRETASGFWFKIYKEAIWYLYNFNERVCS